MTNKTLIISNSYYNLYNFRYSLIKKINNNNNYRLYLCGKNDNYYKFFNLDNLKNFHIYLNDRSYGLINNIISIIQIIKILKKNKFKYILSFTIKPNFFLTFLKFFFKYKLIVTISGLGEIFINKKSLKNKFISYLFLILINKADFIFCHNKFDMSFLLDLNHKLINKINVVNGSGVNLNQYTFHKMILNNKTVFLLPARIIKEKGILEFIAASKQIDHKYPNKCLFHIIGDKYEKSNFNKIFDDLISNSCVQYSLFNEDLKDELIKSTCVVLPSYREGLSKVLIESLAIGRPIITSDVPGCSSLVKDGFNGYVVKPQNVISLATAMEQFLLLSPSDKLKFSKYSKDLSLKYDENHVIDEYVYILNKFSDAN